MAALTAEKIVARYSEAYSVKSTWDSEYREIFEYCMPARDGYDKAVGPESIDPNFQDRRENLYSSVGEQSANEFVNTMQEVLAPPQAPWISIEAGSKFDEKDQPTVNKELGKLCTYLNEYKNNSSFDMAFSEFCYDIYAGTGCMLILPGTPTNPIIFRAIPLREYCIEEGANGEVRAVYRKHTMKRELLRTQWPDIKNIKVSEDNGAKDVTIIESTYYDYDLNVWHYQVTNEGTSKLLLSREYETNPFVVLRWNKCAGEYYGRGVGLTAINDIKTLNLIKYYSLRNFAFNTPPLLVKEDAMLDVDGLVLTPWSLNVVPDTEHSIVPLDIKTDYNIEGYKTQELEVQIKKNTYGFTLPNDAGERRTAYEVATLKQDQRRSLNSVFGRLHSEWQIPCVRRILDVAIDTGILGKNIKDKFKIKDIDGLKYKVVIVTPMSKILKAGEAQAMAAGLGQIAQFDPSGRIIAAAVPVHKVVPRMLELGGFPKEYVHTPEEFMAKQREQGQIQAAQSQEIIDADVTAANEKEAGKVIAMEAAG